MIMILVFTAFFASIFSKTRILESKSALNPIGTDSLKLDIGLANKSTANNNILTFGLDENKDGDKEEPKGISYNVFSTMEPSSVDANTDPKKGKKKGEKKSKSKSKKERSKRKATEKKEKEKKDGSAQGSAMQDINQKDILLAQQSTYTPMVSKVFGNETKDRIDSAELENLKKTNEEISSTLSKLQSLVTQQKNAITSISDKNEGKKENEQIGKATDLIDIKVIDVEDLQKAK